MKTKFLPLLLSLLLASAPAARACSVCGCSLTSDWGPLGFVDSAGTHFSARYEYFDQTRLRSGTQAVARDSLALPNDEEIQLDTTNRNLWFAFDQAIDRRWSVSVQVPWHDRAHRTIAEGDTATSASHARGLGDVRVLARYVAAPSVHRNWSLHLGLKLPTGGIRQEFASGPQAGEPLDRGLQLGSGSTDLLAGVAWAGRPRPDLGLFAQAQLAQPLATRDGFTPAASLSVNAGLRWLNSSRVTPQLQLNVRLDGREHGVNSDHDNSGGAVAHLSPGLTAKFTPRVSGFVFVQLPVWQRWNGLQLQPRTLFITGLNRRW